MRESLPKPLGVIIPTFNRCDALMECLACLERQSFRDFEVVVVDDGSTDSTPELMESYVKKTPLSIQYRRQSNGGPAKARNLAISLIRAPICLMLGDDVFASSTLLERHLAFHRELPDRGVAALGWTQWSESGQTITPFMRWLGESPYQFAYRDLLAGIEPSWFHFYTSNISVKTDLVRRFPFNESFPYAACEDNELGYRIHREHGLKLRFLPAAIAYHLHPTSFRQACERMVRVGYSTRILHELWPELCFPPTPLRAVFDPILRVIGRSATAVRLLIYAADRYTRWVCPNRLIEAAFVCELEIGYRGRRKEAKGRRGLAE